MRRHLLWVMLCFSILHSCKNKNEGKATTADTDSVFVTTNLDCGEYWTNEVVYDTTFAEGIAFKLTLRCQDKVNFIDTSNYRPDTFDIHLWHDIEYDIAYSIVNHPIKIEKNTYKEMLAKDLFGNGFLTPPYDLHFNRKDSSITFRTFIGHADSDVGDVYMMQLLKDGNTKVIAVEPSDMDELID